MTVVIVRKDETEGTLLRCHKSAAALRSRYREAAIGRLWRLGKMKRGRGRVKVRCRWVDEDKVADITRLISGYLAHCDGLISCEA